MPRYLSIQAWRRLRRTMTESELRDLAKDLARASSPHGPYDGMERALEHALISEDWEAAKQV